MALVVLVIILVGAVGYLIFVKKSPTATEESTSAPIGAIQPPPPQTLALNNLGLLKLEASSTKYYQVGLIPEGKYEGYKRIVALADDEIRGPDVRGPDVLILATKDDRRFILDGNPENTTKYPETDFKNPLYFVNRDKISAVDDLKIEHPEVIVLNNNFSLYRGAIYTKKNQGYPIYENVLVTDFSSYTPLTSNQKNLKYYYRKNQENKNSLPGILSKNNPGQEYFDGTTEVIVVDSQGLGYSYNLTTTKNIALYKQQEEKFKQNKSAPPPVPYLPNTRIVKSDLSTGTDVYNTYDSAFPAVCGSDVNTYVLKSVADYDLVKIGTWNGGDIFSNSDTAGLLRLLRSVEFDSKIGIYTDDQTYTGNKEFKGANGRDKPTPDEYFAKHPLLFFKDYWDRWVVVGEYDYILPGGCGKPVIYLYTTKPTEVSVKFTSPMRLDIDIPTYNNGWKVFANPDGMLKDLQPEYTNCSLINDKRIGSEYAMEACQRNQYPYLYWAGRSSEKPYPDIDGGWVVKKEGLSSFMNSKLDEVRFNKQEKEDMLSYWLPEMLNKNVPYYKISFLQTREMDHLVPMSVLPRPDTVFRLFLDYVPLAEPITDLKPQYLGKLVRKGFTLVEWGGLKR